MNIYLTGTDLIQYERFKFQNQIKLNRTAQCGDRRAVDIELLAKAQLRGRLVIMAMSQRPENLTAAPLDCAVDRLSAFVRFEPKNQQRENPQKPHQIYYSRLKQHQLPSMFIQSLKLATTERLSVTLDVNHKARGRLRSQPQQQIVTHETLLVNELICLVQSANSSAAPDQRQQQQFVRMNLLALINRDSPAAAQTAIPPAPPPLTTTATPSAPQASTEPTAHLPQTTNQAKRAVQQVTEPTESIQRMDHSVATPPPVLFGLGSPNQLGSGDQGSSFQRFLQFNSNELDSLKLKLKSNSLLMFTVTSCFVILTYTLCLLIYLKSRQRSRGPRGGLGQANRTSETTGNQQAAMNISSPFNLQMPSATRTRLNMMLGSGAGAALERQPKRRKAKRNRADHLQADPQLLDNSSASSSLAFVQSADVLGLPKSLPNYHVRFANNVPSSRHLNYAGQLQGQAHASYGSVNVVRAAIREAATMARTKFRASSFKPNLNVIPETDLEHLHQQTSPIQELFVNFSQEYYDGDDDDEPNNNSTCISLEQIDSLVQEAMSRECSHIAEEVYNNLDSYQGTLFAKPRERPVSRSKILQQVTTSAKHENAHEKENHTH